MVLQICQPRSLHSVKQMTWQLHKYTNYVSCRMYRTHLYLRSLTPGFRHISASRHISLLNCQGFHGQRNLSAAQSEFRLEPAGVQAESFHARDIYKVAVTAVEPRQMIENVLQYDERTSMLTVNNQSYKVSRNVYVVGFGKAVLGMARATEEILGDHIVSGILSIPRGQRESLTQKNRGDLLLQEKSKIQVYEGGEHNLPDEVAHQAALEIQRLISGRAATDLILVLMSGGGSALLPLPTPPITLSDLRELTKMLANHGASVKELNIIRKHIEILKGGGLAREARPARVVSLILSDVIGDPLNLIASGPTVHDQVTARQCMEILKRHNLKQKMPQSIIQHLQKQVMEESARVNYSKPTASATSGGREEVLNDAALVQNVLVGSNTLACQAAALRAVELGYVPYILTTRMEGEARDVGAMLGKLGVFLLMSFDRQLSKKTGVSTFLLELELVKEGISKIQVNEMLNLVNTAYNMGKGLAIISGGETVVNVQGEGVGGRNQELVLSASLAMREVLKLTSPRPVADLALLSADTDGEDAVCTSAGAVINENFAVEAELEGLDCVKALTDNDSNTLFRSYKKGSQLVVTGKTGTNVIDIQVLIVRCAASPFRK